MKRIIAALAALSVTSLFGASSIRLSSPAIILNIAQEQISSNGSNWRTQWGSFSKDFANQRALVVDTRHTLGNASAGVSLYWYFIGKNAPSGGFLIYDFGSKDTTLSSTWSQHVLVSKPISVNTRRDNTPDRQATAMLSNGVILNLTIAGRSGPTVKTGITPNGWCLFVVQDGVLVAETSSTPEIGVWTKNALRAPKP